MRAPASKLAGLAAAVAIVATASTAALAAPDGADACAADKSKLGVSRIVEIDTKDGPAFGHLQYKDLSFLEPGEIVLTFDDGPLRRYTRAVLDALAAHCTKATFFMVGRMAVADPEMVREVARLGHTVGSHTWSHRNLATLAANRAKGEIELGASAVSKALGKPIAPFFRFPYLSDPKSMISYLQSRDTGIFSIEVDSYDYRAKSAEPVQRKVLAQLKDRGKGIILFHDIQQSTAKALADLLDELKSRGYKVVHLVPKKPMATLTEYDAIADKELERKRLAQAGKPLADRAVVWPIAVDEKAPGDKPIPAAEPLPWTQKAAAPASRAVVQPTAAAVVTPAQPVAAAPAEQPAPRPKPTFRHRSNEDLTWQEQMLDYYR
ncbi:MAG: polysaccharide deacetylase family protein [Pseudomonadota bacterium]